MFGCSKLGASALEAFNQFVGDPRNAKYPAIILLEDRQADFAKVANLSGGNRRALSLPAKVKELREVLRELLAPAAASNSPANPV
jgi:hypothetical protein